MIMVTIKDVAKLAGVSVSTASNALNGKYGVNTETRKRIEETAKKLNYTPNLIARSLVSNSTKNICFILSGPSSFNVMTNPAFSEMIRSMTLLLNNQGYYVGLNILGMEEEMDRIREISRSGTADALVLIGTRQDDDKLADFLDSLSIPFILVGRNVPRETIPAVSMDDRQCSYIATRYLIEMGHKQIGYIGNMPENGFAKQRLAGYRQALDEENIGYNPSLVVDGDFYQESGFLGVRQLLRQSAPRPTAIFAANDLMALGVLEGLEHEGLRVPQDISLIGCDNIPNLHLLKVPLTTVSIPFGEIGRTAARNIIAMLEGNTPPTKVILPSELRIRNSVQSVIY
jgi:DNA-binding LacI/PurR family transcriptional regulator